MSLESRPAATDLYRIEPSLGKEVSNTNPRPGGQSNRHVRHLEPNRRHPGRCTELIFGGAARASARARPRSITTVQAPMR